ncbi:MAG: hypothetical protein ACHRHE_10280 [Tepidisphaerales bacterium]
MRKRLAQVAVFLSTACLIASVAGWASSYLARGLVLKHLHTTPPGQWRRPDWWCVGTVDGRVVGIRMVAQSQTNRGDEYRSMATPMLRDAWEAVERDPDGLVDFVKKNGDERFGFGMARMPTPRNSFVDQDVVLFRWWPLSLLTAIWPLRRLYVGARRRARLAAGLCGPCGYDLRHSHGRCPECGAPIAATRLPATPPTDKPAHARVLMHFAGNLLLAGCMAVSLACAALWTMSYFTSDPPVSVSDAGGSRCWCYGLAEGRWFYFRCVQPPRVNGMDWIDWPTSTREVGRNTEAFCDSGWPIPGIRWCNRELREVHSSDELPLSGVLWDMRFPVVVTAASVHLGWGLVPGAVGALLVWRRYRRSSAP